MPIAYKYGKPIPAKRLVLEEPGKPFPFDADRGLVAEVSEGFPVKALVGGMKGKRPGEIREAFGTAGRRIMEKTIQLVDGKYLDRTGEMVEKVARLTGVSFPHRFGRYAELFLLASRPLDRWNIAKATVKELALQVTQCAVNGAMKEAGIPLDGLPCRELCLAAFRCGAEKTGDRLKMELKKELPRDKVCEFVFSLEG